MSKIWLLLFLQHEDFMFFLFVYLFYVISN